MQQVGTEEWVAITYGDGKYVAVGAKGRITSSADGLNWMTPIQVGSNLWRRIAYGNGKFVIGDWSGNISTSTDGKNWTNAIELSPKISYISDIIFVNGTFYVLGTLNSNGYVTTSTDGTNWSDPVILDNSTHWKALAFGNNRLLAVGKYNSTVDTGRIKFSDDYGLSWKPTMSVGTKPWSSIAYGNGKFVVIGGENNCYTVTSSDGETWGEESNIFAGASGRQIIFNNGLFIMLVSTGASKIQISEDAEKWVTIANITDDKGNNIEYLSGFCIVP